MEDQARVVFMGTPEFAVESLKKMIDEGFNVVGVITAPDKPAGRGKKIKKSAVKEFAEKKGIKILQPTNLKSEEFLKDLKNLNPDVQVVVAFRMLPKQVWQMPSKGTFNLHASLLPDYRGAAPINWAIMQGETKTGVTTFFIDEKIDTGEIILQKEVPIEKNENASSLHDKLKEVGAELIIDTLNLITSGKVETFPQPQVENPKKAPKLNKENTRIDWTGKGKQIFDFIRGLSMYPGAWTELLVEGEKKKFIIYKAHFRPEDHRENTAQISTTKKQMRIAVKDGYIIPELVKLQGKKTMDIVSFLNGIKNKDQLAIV